MQSTISQMKEVNFPMTGKDSNGNPCYTQNDIDLFLNKTGEGKVIDETFDTFHTGIYSIDENERYWYDYQNRRGTVDFESGLRW